MDSSIETEFHQAVLTFVDADGRRWLCGAYLGEVKAEGSDEVMPYSQWPDRLIGLARFTIVREDHNSSCGRMCKVTPCEACPERRR